MNLYTISRGLTEAESLLEEAQEQGLSQEELDRLFATLNALSLEKNEKLGQLGRLILNLESDAAAVKAEEMRLAEKRKRIEARVEILKSWLGRFVGYGQKWSDGVLSYSWRKSKAVEVVDESALPADYMTKKVTFTPDKKAIKEAIEKGQEVAGARVVERDNLQIK